ncbi:molybdenum cofactor guanylyltransferase [Candidatus Pelagibacter sp.]|jgi:molybdopterin-guanine dinucleotide biosynthesis protein A|nr:molybdenum cofactor guanylyltransferase [Candidatus Pelagibacter sp.]
MNENNILGVILAGGKSRRFGEDKSKIKLGNKTLLEHVIDKVEKEFSELLIISNNQNFSFTSKKIFLVQDFIKGQLGPLIGVLSAMKWIELNKKNYKWIATFPCDTPFFDIKVIEYLKKKSFETKKKLVFLKSAEKRHNIFGLWSLDLKEILENDINNKIRKVEIWADKIGSDIINIEKGKFDSFLNINTKDDLEIAKEKLSYL